MRDAGRGRVGFSRDPMVLRGSPYDDDAVSRVAPVDIPALAKALKPLGETFAVADARREPETRPLTAEDRRAIIDQAVLVLSELYVHRYMKHTRHAVDPVVALRQLKRRCHALPPYEFHLEILKIFKGLRDIHTSYVLPRPYSDMVAFLPFLLGAYRSDHNADAETETADGYDPALWRNVIVTGLLADFDHPHFRPGVEVLTWNGLPVQEAIRRIGAEEQGSNIHAQFEIGLRLMTVRWFGGSLPPDEFFVTVAYRDRDDAIREIRFPWRVMLDAGQRTRVASVQAMWALKQKYERQDPGGPSVEQRALIEDTVRESLFDAPAAPQGEKRVRVRPVVVDASVDVLEPSIVSIDDDSGTFEYGLIRIRNFIVNPTKFLAAFIDILDAMPQSGIVIDIRSNPGGMVIAAESILQTLTPAEITPLPFQFLATTLVEDLVKSSKSIARKKLRDWDQRVVSSIDVGNLFSRFGTLTKPQQANAVGQRYYGPVALITNAVTYSSGDIFAASFQDHEIGRVIGIDPTTGGGGANMWNHRDCVDMSESGGDLRFLPGGAISGAKMRYAVRRCTRVGQNHGFAIEEEGVASDVVYNLTRDDLLKADVDLLRFVAGLLKDEPKPRFAVRLRCDGASIDVSSVDVEIPVDRPDVRLALEIETDITDGTVEHQLLIDGTVRASVQSDGGRAELPVRRHANQPFELGVMSYFVTDEGERRARPFAAFKRRVVLNEPTRAPGAQPG